MPIIVLLGMLEGYSDSKAEYKIVNKLFRYLQIVVGILILGYSITNAILDFNNMKGTDSIKSFLLPLILMVLYYPSSFLWILYVKYETFFCAIKVMFGNIKKQEIGKYFKKKLLFSCRLNYKKLADIWDQKYGLWQSIGSLSEVDEFIECVNRGIIYRDMNF
jgi:hypothetical protein